MKKIVMRLISIALTFILLLILGGCTRKVYLAKDRYLVSHDSISSIRMRTDTIIEKDSVFVAQRGDTLIRESYRWRTRDRWRIDTVVRLHHDTVRCIEQKEVPVPGHSILSWRERLLQGLGRGALWILFAVAVLLAIRFLYRRNP